jgi:hypothetical protein
MTFLCCCELDYDFISACVTNLTDERLLAYVV